MTATPPEPRRGRRAPRTLAMMAAVTLAGATLVTTAAPAKAETAASTHGSVSYAWQSTVTHQIHVRGYAWDGLHRSSSVILGVVVDNVRLRIVRADLPSPGYNAVHHLTGGHAFQAIIAAPAGSSHMHINVHPAEGGSYRDVDGQYLGHRTPVNERILQIASRRVGDPYVYGAAGPHAFDCSGLISYVYAAAGAGRLPHNTEGQYQAAAVHAVARGNLLRGDIVFYMSGTRAFHVAIYAGNGMQYSAATTRQGVVYQHVWSSNVRFGTTWH